MLIFTGPPGVSSIADHELLLQNPMVIEYLKLPINDKKDMDERLVQLREFFPSLTFHYSDYFGIKPENDSSRKDEDCEYKSTESYYDIEYGEPAAGFPDKDNKSRKIGLTTLEQFQGKYTIGTDSYKPDDIQEVLDLEFFNSLDISNYHILSKINFLYVELRINDIKIIEDIMPYLNVSQFKNIETLREKFSEKDESIKLSEIMKLNGPGIYIHYACRPFAHMRKNSANNYYSNTDNGMAEDLYEKTLKILFMLQDVLFILI